MGPIQTIDELLDLLRRRGLMIAALTILGAAISVALALARPQVYETAAVIQVQAPVVGGQEAEANSQIARVLQTTEQQLTTRENMLAMIERHGLFANAAGNDEEKIYALRTSVTFQSIAAATQQVFGQSTSVSALLITVRLGDAENAARVANDFAQNVLDMSIASQTSRARDTLTFFQSEEDRIARQISALEDEIERYRNANPVSDAGDTANDRSAIETDIRAITQEILATQAELSALRQKERLRETDRRRIIELEALETVQTSQRAALEKQRDAIDARVAQTPEIERQLGAYDRQMEQLQTLLDTNASRKAEAEIALRLEQENHASRFSLLERAIVPDSPAGGGRKKIAMAGTLASMIAALGLALLLDMMNPVIRTASQMNRELGIRPVITLPQLDLRPASRGRRGKPPAE